MININIGTVMSSISEYVEGLDGILSCFHDGYFFSPLYRKGLWDGKTHFLKTKTLKFPTGLLNIVAGFLDELGLEYQINDPGVSKLQVNDISLKGIILRDYQEEAAMTAIQARRGILELATASGKTEIAIAVIKALDRPTLFLVNTKDLLYQTKERIELRTDIKAGMIGDGISDPSYVTVATVQSIEALFKKDEMNTMAFINEFEVLIMDECHHSSSMTFYKIGMFCHSAEIRLGLSGTALRRDKLSNMKAIAVLGDIIYRMSARDLIAKGDLADVEIRIVPNTEKHQIVDYPDAYDQGITQSDKRNALICDRASRAFKADGRCMILIRRLDHGKRLADLLGKNGIPTVFLIGQDKIETREKAKKSFNADGKFVLIASPIFDEGVDLPEINTLIIAGGGKSETKVIQNVGRGLRKKRDGAKLIVYDFDDATKYLAKHSAERMAIYQREGFTVIQEE